MNINHLDIQLVKKPQQGLYFLRSCTVESILTSCVTVWYTNTTTMGLKHLRRLVKTAQKIARTPQESCLQFPQPPSAQTVNAPTLWMEIEKCEVQELQTEEHIPNLSHQTFHGLKLKRKTQTQLPQAAAPVNLLHMQAVLHK